MDMNPVKTTSFAAMGRILAIGSTVVLVAGSAQGADFVNLTFDNPDLSHARMFAPPAFEKKALYAPVGEALRGWTFSTSPSIEGTPWQGLIGVDGTGGGVVALLPTDQDGHYMLGINNEWYPGVFRGKTEISQRGDIPSLTPVLAYYSSSGKIGESGSRLYINGGEVIPYTLVTGSGRYYADLSSFAGQTVDLRVQFLPGLNGTFEIFGFQAVPEPSTFLLALGGFVWISARFYSRRRK